MLGASHAVEGDDRNEAGNHLGVPGPQAPGFPDQAIEPFQAKPRHQRRSARDRTGVHVERSPDAHGDHTRQGGGVRLHEQFLFRRAEADPQDLRAVGAKPLVQGLGFQFRQGAIRERLGPRHRQAGYPCGHLPRQLLGHARTSPEEEMAPARLDAGPGDELDRLDARHLRDCLVTPQPSGPGNGTSVRADEQGGVMGRHDDRVVLCPDDAMRVAEHHEGSRSGRRAAKAASDRGNQSVHIGDRDRNATEIEMWHVGIMTPGAPKRLRIRRGGGGHATSLVVAVARAAMASR